MGMIKINNADISRPFSMILDLDTDLPNEKTIHNHIAAGQYYEPDVAKVFMQVLKPGDVMIDVGGNAGFFTVLGAALVGSSGRLLSFEPDQRNVLRLKNNVQINNFENVIVIERPAMDEAKSATFFINNSNSGGSALWDVATFPGNESMAHQSFDLDGTTIDTEAKRFELSKIKLIKIDTEGAEHTVLKGASEVLANAKIPFIIAELHEFGLAHMGSSQMALRNYMKNLGYDTFMLYFDGRLPRLVPAQTMIRTPFFCNILFSTVEAVGEYWNTYQHDPGTL